MGGLVTTWPCVEQRRIRRDWFVRSELASEPKSARYIPGHHKPKTYALRVAERGIDRQRKQRIVAIPRIYRENTCHKRKRSSVSTERN